MAFMWQFESERWTRKPLNSALFSLHMNSDSPIRPEEIFPERDATAVIGRYGAGQETPLWVLLDRRLADVRMNGEALVTGIAVLHDRDEILIGGRTRLYFSTEEQPTVEPFPGSAHAVFCARCRQPIQQGTPAVRCPSCGHWCEQTEKKPCWTYGPNCPLCDQFTAFDAGLRWTPDEL